MDVKYICTNSPRFGDMVCLDGDGLLKCVRSEYILQYGLPDGYEPVGSVGEVRGDAFVIDAVDEKNETMLDCYEFEVSGYILDGNPHDIVIQSYYSSTTPEILGTFTYSCDTIDQFCSLLDNFLRSCDPGFDWHAVLKSYDGGETQSVVIMLDKFTQYQQINSPIKSGASAEPTFLNAWPIVGDALAMGYQNGSHKGFLFGYGFDNYFSAKAYGLCNNPEAAAETGEITSSYPIHPDVFERSPKLKKNFVTYDGYLRGHAILLDSSVGAYSVDEVYAKAFGNLAGVEHICKDGSTKPAFIGSVYVSSYSKSHPLLSPGCWFVPTINHISKLMSKIRYTANSAWVGVVEELTNNAEKADILNRTLAKCKVNTISLSVLRWSCVRRHRNSGWIWHGAIGTTYRHGNLYNRSRVRPCALLRFSDLKSTSGGL